MYPVLKSLHVIFVVTWFAGLFYIFRLFVYHRMHCAREDMALIFCTMERKLLYYICIPSSALVVLFGTLMLFKNETLIFQFWLQLKLFLAVLLFGYQSFAVYTYKKFKKQNFFITETSCRFVNEVPSLLLVLMVFLAFLKIQ